MIRMVLSNRLVENDMRVVPDEPAKVPFHEAFYFNAIEILGRPRNFAQITRPDCAVFPRRELFGSPDIACCHCPA